MAAPEVDDRDLDRLERGMDRIEGAVDEVEVAVDQLVSVMVARGILPPDFV